jgi:predicted enzyme related to lactoylglutathione lyase
MAKLVPELLVSNHAVSLDFYVRIVGFAVKYDRPAEKFAYLDLDGVEIMIEQETGFWLTAQREKPYGRGINLQIEVNDLDGILARLLAANIPLFRPVEEAWYRAGGHIPAIVSSWCRTRTAICSASSRISARTRRRTRGASSARMLPSCVQPLM